MFIAPKFGWNLKCAFDTIEKTAYDKYVRMRDSTKVRSENNIVQIESNGDPPVCSDYILT